MKRVPRPPKVCPVCGTTFEIKNWQDSTYCSVKCSRLGIRKQQRQDVTHCLICRRPLTPRQISNRNKYCSRACNGRRMKAWHKRPDIKAQMRTHGLKAAQQGQQAPTKIEVAMRDALNRAGIRHIEQYPIGNSYGTIYRCDFAVPEAMLIIECDGDYWHNLPGVKRKDAHKDKYLRACGYTVLRFTESQIKQDVGECVCHVRAYLENKTASVMTH